MEYLDIRTENGELTGEIKERTQVHTDGDIHGTSHVWLVRYTDKNKKKFDILLQKRAATSTSGSRNVVVWPKYDKNGNLEYIYIYLLTGDYKNISTEFRQD